MELVENTLKWLNGNQWLNFIFLVLSMISIALSIYLYIKSKRRKIPVYLFRHFNLVSDRLNQLEEIKIAYNDKTIKNLSITKVAFWNRGNETINKTDVAPKDPIRVIVSGDSEILNVRKIFVKKEANNFELTISENRKEVYIDFDYFFMHEGVTFEIFHTDTSPKNIVFKGSIKDAASIVSADFNKDFLIDFVFDNTLGRIERKIGKKAFSRFFIIFFPLFFVTYIPLIPFQIVYVTMMKRTIPSEYSLID